MSLYKNYSAVVGGENRFGWRLAIPKAIVKEYTGICWSRAKIIHDRNGMPSIIVAFPDRTGIIVRQYSLVSPNISSTIGHLHKIDYDWSFHCLCPMGVDHVAVVFNSRQDRDRYRFMVFNISTSSLARTFQAVLRDSDYPLVNFYTFKNYQAILGVFCESSIPIFWVSDDYEISKDGYLSKPDPFEYPWNDHQLDAFDSLNLLHPIPCAKDSMSKYFYTHEQQPMDFDVCIFPSHHGILRRWSKVPSLKVQAAEALFRSRPNLDRWKLKKEVGFNIFDGMSKPDPLPHRVEAPLRKERCGCSIL